jgi:FK506-binding nuclear protein
MVTGTHDVYLTGNYVEPDHTHGPGGYDSDDDSDDEDEYDLSPDEDELYGDESEDELDDLENPRVTEIEDEAPALVKADKKGKNKRAAEEEAETLDDLISKAKPAADKKNAKKVKTNEGKAVPADEAAKKLESTPASAKSDKKVQFAKNLEQGPTGSSSPAAATAAKPAEKPKAASAVKTINGVQIDDKKIGSGPAAKKGDRIGMRYIGKLQNGKVFDSNKKGKPFSFKLGTGEVIKGWDIGIAGMQVGGERRVTVPAHHAYGSQTLPGIPKNSTLIFDVKCVEIK